MQQPSMPLLGWYHMTQSKCHALLPDQGCHAARLLHIYYLSKI